MWIRPASKRTFGTVSYTHLIPKLSLQPLVENALLHGILYCDKTEKRLVIRAWRSSRAFGCLLYTSVVGAAGALAAGAQSAQDGAVSLRDGAAQLTAEMCIRDSHLHDHRGEYVHRGHTCPQE